MDEITITQELDAIQCVIMEMGKRLIELEHRLKTLERALNYHNNDLLAHKL